MKQPTSYDEVPYQSDPYPQSHPDQLTTIASLLGAHPEPVDRCRLLELGCASGGNLIPMAESLPESSFVGIDLSARQIDAGKKLVETLQLANIELKEMDITDVDQDLGTFDYIICHGVYSWVPPEVQNRILEICDRRLARNGVAYVSYNTFPGWHFRRVIRDMASYHGAQYSDSMERVKQCRRLLKMIETQAAQQSDAYSHLLQAELENAELGADSYFFHEHLEVFNSPVYFHQFIERAATHGLQYVGEANLAMMLPIYMAPDVATMLQSLSVDHIHLEQYMDFLRNQLFRQTLLCHDSVSLDRQTNVERLAPFQVCYTSRPVSPMPSDSENEAVLFRSQNGAEMTVNNNLVATALSFLAETWPRSVTVDQLLLTARDRLRRPAEDTTTQYIDRQILGQWLLIAASLPVPLVDLRISLPRFVAEVSTHPKTSPLARIQAQQGEAVTNRRHQIAVLNELHRQLVLLLDGTRDRSALYESVNKSIDEGVVVLEKDSAESEIKIEDLVDEHLDSLMHVALLID